MVLVRTPLPRRATDFRSNIFETEHCRKLAACSIVAGYVIVFRFE